MSVVDRPGVQRAIRIPLGVVCALAALACLAIAPFTIGVSLPPAMVAAGLAVWLFADPGRPPPRLATRLTAWGLGLIVFGLVAGLVASLVLGPAD